jgi:hypothetical protein
MEVIKLTEVVGNVSLHLEIQSGGIVSLHLEIQSGTVLHIHVYNSMALAVAAIVKAM